MAGFLRVRRLLLVNALIFAVLAAAVALAYYGFSYTSDVSDRERQLLREVAREKVLNIEFLITDADRSIFGQVRLESLSNLGDLVNGKHAAVASVFVLDRDLELVPDGYVSSRPSKKEGVEFRDYFLAKVLPRLRLKDLRDSERHHVHGLWDGKPYLFSFARKGSGDGVYYIVIEEDLVHLVAYVFPQFFTTTNIREPRLYQVVDETGRPVYGTPFLNDLGSQVVEWPFDDTVDRWILRVSQRDLTDPNVVARRRAYNSLLIGGAVTVIVAGLGFLALAIRRERRANELKSDFISNVSHELKTPLSIISMFGEMLAAGRTKSPEQATEYAEIIWRESVRLGRLIDNVLDFAKIERGMGVYEFAESDISEVVARAIEVPQRRLAAAGMTIEADLEPDLPPVKLDANAFTLAVLNLIDNAIKYAAEGKKIELKLRRDDDRLMLSVRDWGPGIPPEEHAHIFDRFYRARAIRLKPIRGSGIGLALVRHIARAHGGDVHVDSSPGKGATFHLWIPLDERSRVTT
jgi:two-component system, OmpR family, phosphate regulon sensor histidine kinase PhoR